MSEQSQPQGDSDKSKLSRSAMYEEQARNLEKDGIDLDDLREGQTLHYLNGDHRYSFKVIGRDFSARYNKDMPLITAECVAGDGEVLETSGGKLLGVSLSGDGKYPVPYMPPDGSDYIPLIIEILPAPEEPEPDKVMVFDYHTAH